MIQSGLMFYEDEIIFETDKKLDSKTETLLKTALKELSSKSVSKVVQLKKIRLGVSSFKYKNTIIAFGVYGSNVSPKLLLDCSADFAEIFIQKFSKLEIKEKKVLKKISNTFEDIITNFNKKIKNDNSTIIEIDKNLEEGMNLSKKSLNKFYERENDLNEMNMKSSNLSRQALDFQETGRRLKQEVMRQKIKVYVVCATVMFVFVFFIFKTL